jgi:hypothetical protein
MALDDVCDELVEQRAAGAEENARASVAVSTVPFHR